ncbi:MAG: pyruvate synthase [Lachnospiraceae bacterium]|nr:pyruvate synthase [Lachnospiraceae bacterium]
MKKQVMEYASGNEMAAIAIKQIGYDLMGYYPITPSTQIAENLDIMRANGETDLVMVAAEGEHSAAGICYGASVAGGRVINATSANGLLYAIEQFPVQSGTRYPMVMNVVCRTVSGPLSIKGDHSDIMYILNAGWPILFASTVQQVYDFNIIALKLAEAVRLPVVVAYDGFFTSHQKSRCNRFEEDETVKEFIGEKQEKYPFLDLEHPITVGSYMNEPDIINNRYQLHLAMEEASRLLPQLFAAYKEISGREYGKVEGIHCKDAKNLLVLLGSSYDTAMEAVEEMRQQGEKVGAATLHVLRPFPAKELAELIGNATNILVADRQDSYGAGGGNLSLEVRAAMQKNASRVKIKSLVYGLGGKDFFKEDAKAMLAWAEDDSKPDFAYYGVTPGETAGAEEQPLFAPVTGEMTRIGATKVECAEVTQGTSGEHQSGQAVAQDAAEQGMAQEASTQVSPLKVTGGTLNAVTAMPGRIAPGHGACPGCGIPVNLNLLLRGIEDPVVFLFQTGCGMIVTTAYPRTSFKVPYLHNLFQNGAATLSGVAEICYRKQQKGEIPPGDIIFVMVSGDGGMDIGMGSAIGTALRGHRLLIFEYDNGGYMNTGYQLSYSTPLGARSSTSHVGKAQYGKTFFHKDMPKIMAATGIPYVATVAESNPTDFIKKAAKAAYYAKTTGTAYVKAISACPLNWNDKPATERRVIEAAVNSCYFPLYEVEQGVTRLSYDPEKTGKKIPVLDWLSMMGRTKHLQKEEYRDVVERMQQEIDNRFYELKKRTE